MDTINDSVRNVIDNSEIVAIVTGGEDGPHLVATWGDFVRQLEVDDGKTIVIPAGGYSQTEKNFKKDNRVKLLIGSRQVQGKNSMGTGYRLSGHAKIVTKGEMMDLTKSKFPWARAALVIEVDKAEQLL